MPAFPPQAQPLPLTGLKNAMPASAGPIGDSSGADHQVYQGPENGPFRCDNCSYFSAPGSCSQPDIVQLQQGVVDPGGCCDYFESLGIGQATPGGGAVPPTGGPTPAPPSGPAPGGF